MLDFDKSIGSETAIKMQAEAAASAAVRKLDQTPTA